MVVFRKALVVIRLLMIVEFFGKKRRGCLGIYSLAPEPLLPSLIPINELGFWNGVVQSEGDEVGGSFLFPMRQFPLGDVGGLVGVVVFHRSRIGLRPVDSLSGDVLEAKVLVVVQVMGGSGLGMRLWRISNRQSTGRRPILL
jgi:hypothetical protein